MPDRNDDDIKEPEEPTNRERRRIQQDARVRGGNRWGVAPIGEITYEIPQEVRTNVEKIRAGDLLIDDRYNRSIDHSWVEMLATVFNPDQLQVLNVSRRLYRTVQRSAGTPREERVYDGNLEAQNRVEYVVISGQHRLLATLRAKTPDFLLWCNIFDGLHDEEEALLFAMFDERVRPHHSWQRHRAYYFAKVPQAVEIDDIAKETGLEVYKGKGQSMGQDGLIYAVTSLYGIYRKSGPDFLRRLLQVHYGAWGDYHQAYTASLIQGTAVFMRRFAKYSRWKDEYLMRALSDPSHNPLMLVSRAKGAATGIGATSVAQEVGRIEHGWYQTGLKGYDRLPEWRATDKEIETLSQAAEANLRGGGRRRRNREDGDESEDS